MRAASCVPWNLPRARHASSVSTAGCLDPVYIHSYTKTKTFSGWPNRFIGWKQKTQTVGWQPNVQTEHFGVTGLSLPVSTCYLYRCLPGQCDSTSNNKYSNMYQSCSGKTDECQLHQHWVFPRFPQRRPWDVNTVIVHTLVQWYRLTRNMWAVVFLQPKYRLCNPKKYLFLLSKKIFSGWKYTKKTFILNLKTELLFRCPLLYRARMQTYANVHALKVTLPHKHVAVSQWVTLASSTQCYRFSRYIG